MNYFFIYILILLYINQIKGLSEEYYKCIDPDIEVVSPSVCTSIIIPKNEGYKCCSMKVRYKNTISYKCLPIENQFTSSQKLLDEYIFNKSLAFLFTDTGGNMEIECPNSMKAAKEYNKLSDDFLSCYDNYIKGVQNENDCIKNDFSTEETGKCCFLEKFQNHNNGVDINDKRCFIIQDKYFTQEKNFTNFLLEKSNIESMAKIINTTNFTIKCEGYPTFFFPDKLKNNNKLNSSLDIVNGTTEMYKESGGIKKWKIIIIIICICCVILITAIIFAIIFVYRKRRESLNPKTIVKKEVEIKEKKTEGNLG